MKSHYIGWDIGGAHLKAAVLDRSGTLLDVVQQPTPVWQGLQSLSEALSVVLSRFASVDAGHAITMTAELADIFPDRRSGVAALCELLGSRLPVAESLVYAGPRGLLPLAVAAEAWRTVASANWRASVEVAALRLPSGLFVDIGSTTTDLALFAHRSLATLGSNDRERLLSEELLYLGVVRTPVHAVAHRVPFNGAWIPLMAENFAYAADIFRLTRELPEHADQYPTADGADRSQSASARRLARLVGSDLEDGTLQDWEALAEYVREEYLQRLIAVSWRHWSRGIVDRTAPMVGAGIGRFLVSEIARRCNRPYCDFATLFPVTPDARLDFDAADCAPAAAVAWLCRNQSCPQ